MPPVRINVGCGQTPTRGWLNFDNSWTVRLSHVPLALQLGRACGLVSADSLAFASVARGAGVRWATAWRLPLPDASVEVAYSSHVLEHLDRTETLWFLEELRRVLVPEGLIRLAVPDLARLARRYLETGNADEFVAATLLASDRPHGLLSQIKWLMTGPRHHLWMYDARSLIELLTTRGWRDAAAIGLPGTRIPNPGPLDLQERAEESIYVEAKRPE